MQEFIKEDPKRHMLGGPQEGDIIKISWVNWEKVEGRGIGKHEGRRWPHCGRDRVGEQCKR